MTKKITTQFPLTTLIILLTVLTTFNAAASATTSHPLILQTIFTTALTQSTVQQELDDEIHQQAIDIEQLSLNVLKGHHPQEQNILLIAQQTLLQELLLRNSGYAKAIDALESQLHEIVQSEFGEQALHQYVSGDIQQALTMLDAWALDRNTTTTGQFETRLLVDQRQIAQLAADAVHQGRLDSNLAIERFNRVVAQDPSTHGDWMQLAQLYRITGQYSHAIRSTQQAYITANNYQQVYSTFVLQGDLYYQQGKLPQANRSYQQAIHALNEKTGNVTRTMTASLQLDYLSTLQKLGQLQLERRDFDGALYVYRQALDNIVTIVQSQPDSVQYQQQHADIIERIAQIELTNGLTNSALNLYQQSYDMRLVIASLNSTTETQRDISVTLDRIGDLKKELDMNNEALIAYRQSYDIRQKIVDNHPTSTTAQRDIAVSLTKMAAINQSGIRWEQVLKQFESMDSKGQLAPDDREYLVFSREMATLQGATP